MIFVSRDEEPPSINPASFLILYQCIWRISISLSISRRLQLFSIVLPPKIRSPFLTIIPQTAPDCNNLSEISKGKNHAKKNVVPYPDHFTPCRTFILRRQQLRGHDRNTHDHIRRRRKQSVMTFRMISILPEPRSNSSAAIPTRTADTAMSLTSPRRMAILSTTRSISATSMFRSGSM